MNEEQYEAALREEIRNHFWASRQRSKNIQPSDWDLAYESGLYKALTLLAAYDGHPVDQVRRGERDDVVICENCGGDGVLSKERPPEPVVPNSPNCPDPFGPPGMMGG